MTKEKKKNNKQKTEVNLSLNQRSWRNVVLCTNLTLKKRIFRKKNVVMMIFTFSRFSFLNHSDRTTTEFFSQILFLTKPNLRSVEELGIEPRTFWCSCGVLASHHITPGRPFPYIVITTVIWQRLKPKKWLVVVVYRSWTYRGRSFHTLFFYQFLCRDRELLNYGCSAPVHPTWTWTTGVIIDSRVWF